MHIFKDVKKISTLSELLRNLVYKNPIAFYCQKVSITRILQNICKQRKLKNHFGRIV